MERQIEQTKNDFVVYRALYNEDLHNAIMSKDIEKVELIIAAIQDEHAKYYDFLLFDPDTILDIDMVIWEYELVLKEEAR